MQFIITAKDFPDALERRLACRDQHIALIDELKAQGHFFMGGALVDENSNMAGSVLIGEFESEEALEEIWLDREPYVLNKVWETIGIQEFRVGPSFLS